MALQGYDIEVRYAQNNKMALGQGLGLAECQHWLWRTVRPQLLLVTTPSLLFNHHYCEKKNMDENQVLAGVGIIWVNYTINKPEKY